MADPVLNTKIAVLVLFFVVTMMCGLLPMLLVRLARSWTERFEAGRGSKLVSSLRKHGDLVVSCIMCLGAGVLLATIFTHMIPEVREVFVEIEEAGLFPDTGLPPGELFLCAGFFLVYFIEEMVHTFLARGRRKKHRRTAADAVESGEKQTVAEEPSEGSEESDHDHKGHDHVADIVSQQAFRAYLVVIALSVHSVFEGFAAAFEDSAREVWVFFAAIMAHKTIVAFCIGEQLLSTKRSACFIVSSLSIFSLATPLGVLLGLVVASPAQQGGASLLATGILQGLAAGTILYVIFFELLGPEQRKPGPGLVKLFAMLFGFGLMLVVHSTGGHSHSHEGHSHAVEGNGHGAHGNHAMHHGHDQGDHADHADHIDDVAASVEGAIRAHNHDHDHDEGHSDHSDRHDHSDHAGRPQESGHRDQHDHDHDHGHGHGHGQGHDQGHGHDHDYGDHPNHVIPSKPGKSSSDRSRHADHDQHGHSDHHDHATHADHIDHPESVQPVVDVPGANSTTYEIFGTKGEAEGDVVIRQVPKGNPSPSANDTKVEDEEHHFHSDGHDHLAPETGGNAVHEGESGRDHSGHEGHDHSDHAGHDHSDPEHGHASDKAPGQSKHAGHADKKDGTENHSDHSGHDHSDHAGHDHGDHAGHHHSDHAGHHHSDHAGHDHSDHSKQPPRDGAGRGIRHPDHAHEHKANAETPSLETGAEMTANSGNSRMADASRNSAARPAADHEHSHPAREGHKLGIEGSGSFDQPGATEEEPAVTHELSEISSVVTDPKQ